MNCLRTCMLFFVLTSIGLYAGVPERIELGSLAQLEIKLSVEQKDNPQNPNTVMVTVSFKGDELTEVNLVTGGKNVSLNKVMKAGMVSVAFEIEKGNIEKSFVHIKKNSPVVATCGNTMIVYLKEYIV